MDPTAVEKAKRRLAKAEECLAIIEQPQKGHDAFLPVWTDFLLALGGVYTVLEQGAKVSPQSRQWFGAKKRQRSEDELLQYLHQARNADEHGIDPVSKIQRARIVSMEGEGAAHIEHIDDRNFDLVLDKGSQSFPTVKVETPAIRLVPVTDTRFGTTFQLPTKHLNTPLTDNYPLTVARLGVAYVRTLVAEAETIAQKTSVTTKSSG